MEIYLGTSQEPQYTVLLKIAALPAIVAICKHLFQLIQENRFSFGISLKNVCMNIAIIQTVKIVVKSLVADPPQMAAIANEHTPFAWQNVTSAIM